MDEQRPKVHLTLRVPRATLADLDELVARWKAEAKKEGKPSGHIHRTSVVCALLRAGLTSHGGRRV